MPTTPSERFLEQFKEGDILPPERIREAALALGTEVAKLGRETQLNPVELIAMLEGHLGAAMMFYAQMFLDLRDEVDQMWDFLKRSIGGKRVNPPQRDYTGQEEMAHIAAALRLDRLRRLYDIMFAKLGKTDGGLYVAKSSDVSKVSGQQS